MYNQTKRMMAIGGFCLISSIALSAQISLKLHNKKTSDVITEIEQVSDYRFFYNNGLSGLSKVISVQADNADIRSVLEQIKQQTGISYLIKDNKQIVLSASESSQQQRNVTVHGTVTDTQGLPKSALKSSGSSTVPSRAGEDVRLSFRMSVHPKQKRPKLSGSSMR